MATRVSRSAFAATTLRAEHATEESAKYLVPLGRVLFALIFIASAMSHFSTKTIAMAAAHGIPAASFLVPAAGILAVLGGLSIAIGFHARLGAVLLLVFLVPVTVGMHDFWNVADPMMRQLQMVNFMKNLSLIGATLLIGYFGAGPYSADTRAGR